MRKSIYKLLVILILIIITFVVTNQFTVVQKLTARLTTFIYVKYHYSDLEMQYQSIEFVPQFGDYNVTYSDKNGKMHGFMVTPKFMPIFILYDSINPPN